MEQKNNGHYSSMRHEPQPRREGAEPSAAFLTDVLTRLGLSNAPPGLPMNQYLAALGNASWRIRAQAVQALGDFGEQVAIERIILCLKDEHEAVRMAAVRALGKLSRQRPEVVEHIRSAWKDRHPEVRATVVQVMATLEIRVSTDFLEEAIGDEDKIVRIAALKLAATQGVYAPLHMVAKALQDEDWQIREEAALTIGRLGKGAAVKSRLVRALYDPSRFVRHAAVAALGSHLPVEVLVHDLRSGEPSVREQTARILGELGNQAQEQSLAEAALTDSESAVRVAAVLALGQLDKRVSLKHLQRAVQDSDPAVRAAAELVLDTYSEMDSTAASDMVNVQTPDSVEHEKDTENDLSLMAVYERRYISSGPAEVNYVGQRFGNYELTERIGGGGLATVYRGRHIYLNTPAAIKVLKGHMPQRNLDRFLTEARTVAQLTHPHIVRVLDFGISHGIPFLAMEYAAQGNLRQLHPPGEQIPLDTVISYTKQVAGALHYAHNRGMVHRDVKPENMLLGDSGAILLSDFGITVQTEYDPHHPYQQTVSGTPSYIAPEQLLGETCAASDQYSLGVVVYEWLCGSLPFTGSLTSVIDQHLENPPPRPREKNPHLSRNVENVVLKALVKNPQERYPGVRDFALALEQASQGSTSQSSFWHDIGDVFARLLRNWYRRSGQQ